MGSHALLTDAEGGEPVEHGERRGGIGGTVVQSVQHVAMEIDEAHREALGVAQGAGVHN
jgi:hypothetical protein